MQDLQKTLAIVEVIVTGHENNLLFPYMCTENKLTIGRGRNLTDVGISADESDFLFANDCKRVVDFLSKKPYFAALSPRRKAALIDLCFCVGPTRYNGFKKMEAALLRGDFTEAGRQIMDSKFAIQTKHRAVDLDEMLRHADTPYSNRFI